MPLAAGKKKRKANVYKCTGTEQITETDKLIHKTKCFLAFSLFVGCCPLLTVIFEVY